MCLLCLKWCFWVRRANIMVNLALQTRETTQNHDFFIKNQAKSFIHVFPCQNFPTVNRSSRHAYRGAGGAAGATWGECQRPRITRIGAGAENGPSRRRLPPWIPFFERFLWDIPAHIASTCSKKALTKKKEQTHKHTKSDRSGARPGPCFGQPNVRY